MHWFGLLCLAGATFIVFRWFQTRFDSLGRQRDFPWISTVVLVVAGLALFTPLVLRVWVESRISSAASEVVGASVEVECQSFGGAFVDAGAEFGYVAFGPDGVPERKALIKRDQCRDLSAYLRSDKESPSTEQIVAVHTLTHEAIHMSGVTNEAETECNAVQRDAEMARALGASPDAATRLANTYWTVHYPRLTTEYRSADCPGPAGRRSPATTS